MRYKLLTFDIPIYGPANLFCDNEAFYRNSMFAELQLSMKHRYIFFHRFCDCVASGILIPHKVNTNYNLADLLTKSLSVENRIVFSSCIIYSDNPNI